MTSLIGSRNGWGVLVLLVCAGACRGGSPAPDEAGSGGEAAVRAKPAPDAAETVQPVVNEADWAAGVLDVRSENDSVAVLRAVRVGRHEGFERITFEFEGDAMPGYHIEYVDRPVYACGSGEVVPLEGDAFLSIRFSPAVAHTEQGEPTVSQREMRIGQPIVRELERTCDFEADVTWVTGQSTPAPYAARVLRSPLRLVVDLRG